MHPRVWLVFLAAMACSNKAGNDAPLRQAQPQKTEPPSAQMIDAAQEEDGVPVWVGHKVSTARADESASPAREATVVDLNAIVGYMQGNSGPEEPTGGGQVSTLKLTPFQAPFDENMAGLDLVVRGPGKDHAFRLALPRALPLPFARGEQVSFRSNSISGGPNRRADMVITAADGSLLLAVGGSLVPQGWTVKTGRRVERRHESDYVAHGLEVAFAREGDGLTVAPGKWARLDTSGESYLVWANAVERVRKGTGPPPRDYVGGWMDFAIVRLR